MADLTAFTVLGTPVARSRVPRQHVECLWTVSLTPFATLGSEKTWHLETLWIAGRTSLRRIDSAVPTGPGSRARCHPWSTARADRSPRSGSNWELPGSGRPRPSARRWDRPRSVPQVRYQPRRPRRHRLAARLGFRSAWRLCPPMDRTLELDWSGTHPGRCSPARAGAASL